MYAHLLFDKTGITEPISNFTMPVSLANMLLSYLLKFSNSHKIVHNILWSTVISHLYNLKLSIIPLSIPRTGYLCILFYTLLFLSETANFTGLFKGTIFGFVDSTLCLHSKMLISVLICICYIVLNHSRWEFSLCFQINPNAGECVFVSIILGFSQHWLVSNMGILAWFLYCSHLYK